MDGIRVSRSAATKTEASPSGARGSRRPQSAEKKRGDTGIDLLVVTVSGFAARLAFPGYNLWLLLPIALAALISVVDRVRPWRAAGYSALWAMVFFLPLISWMQIATDHTWLAWFALAGAQAFFLALWGLSFAATRTWAWARTITGEAVTAGLLWVAFEELRSRVPFGGFPWGKLAYPQVNGPLLGLAPYGGEALVSFVVVVIAVLARRAFAFRSGGAGEEGMFARGAAAALALALFVLPGLIPLSNRQEAGELQVALIQGNVEIPMAETFATPRKVTGNHVRETEVMLAQPQSQSVDLILWGENSTDLDPRTDAQTAALVQSVVDESGIPLMLGIMEYSGDERYNWMSIWDPDTGLSQSMYGKQHPVPWGEYVPFRQVTEFLATAAAQVSIDMVAVDNPALMTVTLTDGRVVPLAVGICFEVAYEPLIAAGVSLGGQAIVIPTNNAHFQNSDESVQQLQMAQFRAAEFSRAAVQVSTNGVSGVIRPDGSLVAATETQEAAHLVASLPLRTSITPFTRMAQVLPLVVISAGLGCSVAALVSYRRGRRAFRRAGQPRR